MNSRERVLSALALKEPDIVPFADWIDEGAKPNLVKSMGEKNLNEAELVKRLNMDALIFFSDGGGPQNGHLESNMIFLRDH